MIAIKESEADKSLSFITDETENYFCARDNYFKVYVSIHSKK